MWKAWTRRLRLRRFDVDVADGAQRHASAGIETLEHALLLAVAREFFLEGPEDFGIDRLELEADLVVDSAAAFDAVAALSLQAVGHQAAAFGQRMMGGGGHFGERQSAVAPRDDVAGAGDVDLDLVVAALDRARRADLEQFRMQRAVRRAGTPVPRLSVERSARRDPFFGLEGSVNASIDGTGAL